MTAYDVAIPLSTRGVEREQPEQALTALSRLRERAQVVRLGNRCPMVSLGSGSIYIAAKGVVGIEAATPNSDVRVITSLLYPGDILVPEMQAPLAALALVSQRPTEFWKLTSSAFAEEARSDSQCWHTTFKRLNDQIARGQLHATAMSTLNSEERVAAFLIEAGLRVGAPSGGAIAFELPL
jgi:CRP/FNR family transcriptional regulator